MHPFPPVGFKDRIVCKTFDRWGGVSKAPYDELNVGLHVGDDPEAVRKNRRIVASGMGALSLVSSFQVHGENIELINDPMDGLAGSDILNGVDGLMTNRSGVGLMIQHADCQAIVFFDPVTGAAANIHCGWRGSVLNMPGKAVNAMARSFGSNPGDMLAWISPSLGPCCAEFKGWRELLPASFLRFKVSSDRFDFWAATKAQLSDAGVKSEHIYVSGDCTFCNENYYSYRRDGTTGRCATVVMLL
ncbi:MAG: peptidoglycan editing factor PgeF [Desulfobacteraceae bacterium]|nr:peptidoglycan editing factor PgeF [Desulfobacteraceae bacterium]